MRGPAVCRLSGVAAGTPAVPGSPRAGPGMRENCQGLDPEARIRNKAVLVTSNVTAVFMSFSLFASDFRGSFPRPGPSGLRTSGVSPPCGRRLGFSEVSGRRAAVPTAGPAQSPSPRFPRCPLRTPFPASFEVQPSFETFRGRKMALRGSRGRPGASGAEALPLPQAGSASGSSCGRRPSRGLPPLLAPRRPQGRFQLPWRCWKAVLRA